MDTTPGDETRNSFNRGTLSKSSRPAQAKYPSDGGSLGQFGTTGGGCKECIRFQTKSRAHRSLIRVAVDTLRCARPDFAGTTLESSPIPDRNHAVRKLPPVWQQHSNL